MPAAFAVTRTAPNRLEITISGKLDGPAMEQALDDLVRESEGMEGAEMLFVVDAFELPTLEGIRTEFSRMPSMAGFIRKFRRCAVLADQGWLRTVAALEGAFIPGVEIRGFLHVERDQAEAWLAGGD
jgi:hypothetical protein